MRPPRVFWSHNRYAARSKTLGALLQEKVALVIVCQRCKHRSLVHPSNLIPHLGADFRALALRARLRCRECGGRGMANVHESSR